MKFTVYIEAAEELDLLLPVLRTIELQRAARFNNGELPAESTVVSAPVAEPSPVAVEEKPKRTRAKTAPAAAPQPVVIETPEPAPVAAAVAEPFVGATAEVIVVDEAAHSPDAAFTQAAETFPTEAQCVEALKAFATNKSANLAKAVTILSEIGVQKVSQLSPAQRATFLARLQAAA